MEDWESENSLGGWLVWGMNKWWVLLLARNISAFHSCDLRYCSRFRCCCVSIIAFAFTVYLKSYNSRANNFLTVPDSSYLFVYFCLLYLFNLRFLRIFPLQQCIITYCSRITNSFAYFLTIHTILGVVWFMFLRNTWRASKTYRVHVFPPLWCLRDCSASTSSSDAATLRQTGSHCGTPLHLNK